MSTPVPCVAKRGGAPSRIRTCDLRIRASPQCSGTVAGIGGAISVTRLDRAAAPRHAHSTLDDSPRLPQCGSSYSPRSPSGGAAPGLASAYERAGISPGSSRPEALGKHVARDLFATIPWRDPGPYGARAGARFLAHVYRQRPDPPLRGPGDRTHRRPQALAGNRRTGARLAGALALSGAEITPHLRPVPASATCSGVGRLRVGRTLISASQRHCRCHPQPPQT